MSGSLIDIRVRFPVDDVALSQLHRRAFGSSAAGTEAWAARLERHSLTWVGAFDGETPLGFVQVCWDGGAHAFILDTVVDLTHRRRGIGQQLVEAAVEEVRKAGCEWVHVDFEPQLSEFYVTTCGFRPTAAGLYRL